MPRLGRHWSTDVMQAGTAHRSCWACRILHSRLKHHFLPKSCTCLGFSLRTSKCSLPRVHCMWHTGLGFQRESPQSRPKNKTNKTNMTKILGEILGLANTGRKPEIFRIWKFSPFFMVNNDQLLAVKGGNLQGIWTIIIVELENYIILNNNIELHVPQLFVPVMWECW